MSTPPLGEYSLGEFSLGEFSIGEFSLGEFSLGEFSLGEFSKMQICMCGHLHDSFGGVNLMSTHSLVPVFDFAFENISKIALNSGRSKENADLHVWTFA